MDVETENILKQWDLTDYIDVFKDNNIDAPTLSLFNNDMIKELIKPISGTAIYQKLGDLEVNYKRRFNIDSYTLSAISMRVGVLYVSQSIRSRTRSVKTQQESESFVDALTEKHKNIAIPLKQMKI